MRTSHQTIKEKKLLRIEIGHYSHSIRTKKMVILPRIGGNARFCLQRLNKVFSIYAPPKPLGTQLCKILLGGLRNGSQISDIFVSQLPM